MGPAGRLFQHISIIVVLCNAGIDVASYWGCMLILEKRELAAINKAPLLGHFPRLLV